MDGMTVESKMRHIIEALVSAFLVAFQYVPAYGMPVMGPMILPLATYITGLLWIYNDSFGFALNQLLFSKELMFGRIVAVTGLAIFLVALFQFLRRRDKIITSGLYSAVRHPQYFGIIVMTLGISIMSIQYTTAHRAEVFWTWLIQVLGYVLLAGYEERHLIMEYETDYHQYRQKVPLIFPVPATMKIPEPLLSIILAMIIAFLLTLL